MNDTDAYVLGSRETYWTRTMEDRMLALLRQHSNDYNEVCRRLRRRFLKGEQCLTLEECYCKRQELMRLG